MVGMPRRRAYRAEKALVLSEAANQSLQVELARVKAEREYSLNGVAYSLIETTCPGCGRGVEVRVEVDVIKIIDALRGEQLQGPQLEPKHHVAAVTQSDPLLS